MTNTMLPRRHLLLGTALLPLASAARAQTSGEPVVVGISGPLTGQYAQYGAQWKKGFDLAVEQANAAGGVRGRPLAYDFQDSQSDPRQSVALAQKFVNDPRIVAELGDFSSAASMAASPIYQRGQLVQFGFTNSHPDFTKGGDYMWSNAPNQAEDMPILADLVVKRLGLKKLAVLYVNGDWGKSSQELFNAAVVAIGGQVVVNEGYLPAEKDFRSTLVRVRSGAPDGIVLLSYYPDGALITRQIRAMELPQAVVAAGSIYSPKFLEIAGPAANGVFTSTNFFPEDPRPVARDFVAAFKAKFGVEPDSYNARGYDAMMVLYTVMKQYGADRQAVHDGLGKVRDIPSVIYGTAEFDPATRRVAKPVNTPLVIRDDRFQLWDGTKPVLKSAL
jgi:branched-chain amino acid transport system substrate-binding protein